MPVKFKIKALILNYFFCKIIIENLHFKKFIIKCLNKNFQTNKGLELSYI